MLARKKCSLPFLQTVLSRFKLVPLAVGHASAEEVAQVLEALWGGPETLIPIPNASRASYSPTGNAIAYNPIPAANSPTTKTAFTPSTAFSRGINSTTNPK